MPGMGRKDRYNRIIWGEGTPVGVLDPANYPEEQEYKDDSTGETWIIKSGAWVKELPGATDFSTLASAVGAEHSRQAKDAAAMDGLSKEQIALLARII